MRRTSSFFRLSRGLAAAVLCLLFVSAAWAADIPADGSYTAELTLSGGSGRASVQSPAEIAVKDGQMTACIVWSSSSYDLMVVNGVEYRPVTLEGGSTFVIPVVLGEPVAFSAETLAMSEPHMIDYTLQLDPSTLVSVGETQTVQSAPAAAGQNSLLPQLLAGVAVGAVMVILVLRRRMGAAR